MKCFEFNQDGWFRITSYHSHATSVHVPDTSSLDAPGRQESGQHLQCPNQFSPNWCSLAKRLTLGNWSLGREEVWWLRTKSVLLRALKGRSFLTLPTLTLSPISLGVFLYLPLWSKRYSFFLLRSHPGSFIYYLLVLKTHSVNSVGVCLSLSDSSLFYFCFRI